jgi:hypothetical protein
VYVIFSDPDDYKSGGENPQNPFGARLMRNLPNAMGNISRRMLVTSVTSVHFSM